MISIALRVLNAEHEACIAFLRLFDGAESSVKAALACLLVRSCSMHRGVFVLARLEVHGRGGGGQVLLQKTAWSEEECGQRLRRRLAVLREAGLDTTAYKPEPIFCFETLRKSPPPPHTHPPPNLPLRAQALLSSSQ